MAEEAGLTLEEYWEQISLACFLNDEDPVAKIKEVYSKIENVLQHLNSLEIEKINLKADKTDLWLTIGETRKFIGATGHNIPSFEIFTSPDWRGTNGTIFFDFPLYRYGNIIKDISLTFKDGLIIESTASQNEKLLKEMILQENANKIGEFSLTDKRFSHINKFMAETLFDENFGGEYGNTHLAIGSSYHDTYCGTAKDVSEKGWEDMGFNESAEHCDIIATTNRKVTAVLKGGKEVVIYENGEFVLNK
jgi:aminopeptidase